MALNDIDKKMEEGGVHALCLKEGGKGVLSLKFGFQVQLIVLLKPRSHGIYKAKKCLLMDSP